MPLEDKRGGCAIAVMAKAPRTGQVKTRLVPPLTPDAAAALSASFLRDITENIVVAAHEQAIRGYVAYAPAGLEHLFEGNLAPGTALVLADGSGDPPPRIQGFGRCLFQAAQSLFGLGHGSVCLLNSDSPSLPTVLLLRAAEALAEAGDRVVLGPAEDGGYYLIGMKAAHGYLFEDIAWSTDRVADQTRDRARAMNLELVELAAWYDVDDRAALGRLVQELGVVQELECPAAVNGLAPYGAPVTAARLRQLDIRRLLEHDHIAQPADSPVRLSRNAAMRAASIGR